MPINRQKFIQKCLQMTIRMSSQARAEKGIKKPNIVMPVTGHVAVDKVLRKYQPSNDNMNVVSSQILGWSSVWNRSEACPGGPGYYAAGPREVWECNRQEYLYGKGLRPNYQTSLNFDESLEIGDGLISALSPRHHGPHRGDSRHCSKTWKVDYFI